MGTAYVAAVRGLVSPIVPVGFAVAAAALLLYLYERSRHGATTRIPRTAWLAIGALHAMLLTLPPLLSDDLWRYLFDGMLQTEGLHPWSYAPASPKVADLAARAPGMVNHPELISLYPPAAQLFFGAIAWLGDSVFLWKSLMLGCALATTALIGRAFGAMAAFFFFAHPLTLLAVSSEAHVDSLGTLLLLFAVGSAASLAGRAIPLALAIGVKVFPALLLPVVLASERAPWRMLLLALTVVATLTIVSLPYVHAGTSMFDTLGTYARDWSFNGSLAPVITAAFASIIEHFASGDTFEIAPLSALNAWRGATSVYHGVATSESWWTAVELARVAYRVVSTAALGLFTLWTARRVARARTALPAAALTVLFAWLLLSPVVHPWYLLWLLPISFATARLGFVVRVWSVTILLSYLTPARCLATGEWVQPVLEPLVEYGVLTIACVVIVVRSRRVSRGALRPAPEPPEATLR